MATSDNIILSGGTLEAVLSSSITNFRLNANRGITLLDDSSLSAITPNTGGIGFEINGGVYGAPNRVLSINAGNSNETGSVSFSGSSALSFSGMINVVRGSLKFSYYASTGSVYSKNTINLESGAYLDLYGWYGSPTIGGLSGGGTVLASDANTTGYNLSVGGNNQNTLFSGAIQDGAGAFSLTKVGSGTLTLSGTNTYSGTTTISGGTLALSGSGSVSNSTSVAVNSSLDISSTISGATIRNLSSSGTDIGKVYLGSKVLTILNTASSIFYGVISDDGFVAGTTGSLTKTGTGTLTLSGTNTYTGGTTISAGTLALGVSNAMPDSGVVTINGGTFAMGTFNDSIYSLVVGTSGGSITGSGSLTSTIGYVFNNTSGNALTISAVLAGAGATLTQAGTGTTTLSAA
ncbi:autotransporter-associated beta strand repeat-containing protein, partial [Polynucleobacter sp. Fuers-14]|uniref:autotransporter-associated beta strand repeat-containing protein n=1 Tax=Polynucleobacter sp. Fuers-14 TaxID=1758364 RepID=UPI0027E3162E